VNLAADLERNRWRVPADGLDVAGARADIDVALTQTLSPEANAHQIVLDPSNKYAFVPCLGVDRLHQYVFDARTGTLTRTRRHRLRLPRVLAHVTSHSRRRRHSRIS
jgi:hypothetical protein